MAGRYVLVAVSHTEKGVSVRTISTYEDRAIAERTVNEKKWGGSKGTPYIIREEEVAAFVRDRSTGEFAVDYTPPTSEEIRIETEREKAQEKFESERETAKLPTEEGEVARQLLASKYGIIAEPTRETIGEEKPEVKVAYGGVTKDATPEQIAKAKAEGGEYYLRGVRYTFGGERFTRSDIISSVYSKMGYTTATTPSGIYATKPQEQIIISAGIPLLAKGEVIDPTALKFYPQYISTLREQQAEVKPIIKPTSQLKKGIMQKWAESIELREKGLEEKYRYVSKTLGLSPVKITQDMYTGYGTNIIYRGDINFIQTRKELGLAAYGLTAGLIEEGVLATEKAMFFTAALFQKDKSKAAKEEIIRAAKKLPSELKQQYTEAELFKPTPKGTVSTGLLFGLPLIPALFKITRTGRAKTVLRSIAKERPPDIAGKQYYGGKLIKYGLKTEKIIQTPKIYIKKPSGKITSKYEILIPKPTVTIAESISGKSKYSYITTPKKIQYVTVITKKAGKTYYVRSRIQPTGETITTVYRGDIPLRTFKYRSQPTIKLLEPLEKIKTKEYISIPEFRREIDTGITTSGMVQLFKKGKYEVKGLRVRGTRDFLVTKTEKPRVEILGTPVLDLLKGTKSIKPISIKIGETRYRYVDYPPKQKPFYTATGDFGIFVKRPTISKTIQVTKIKEPFLIKFVETKKTKTLSEMFKSKRGELIPKEKLIQEIQRPLIKPKLKGDIAIYLPTSKFIPTVPPSIFPIVLAAGIPIAAARLGLEPKAKTSLLPKTEPIIDLQPKIKTELLPKIEPIIELQPKTKAELLPKTEAKLVQEQILKQEVIPAQILKQELIGLETTTDLIRPITRVPPPPPPFIFGLSKQKVKLLAAATKREQGYDVLVKRKQLKKGKGSYESRGYEKANTVPLTKKAALGLGASIVDTYTNRSYRIKKTKEVAVKRAELRQKWNAIKGKFRRSKTSPNVITEKTKYAIDSPTEKKGIPYEARRLRMLGLLNTKKKQKRITNLMNIKKSNSFLTARKKRKGATKWL